MDLKNLISSEKTIKEEFPGCEDFVVELAYLSREELLKVRNKCMTNKLSRKTRQMEEKLDEDLFLKIYITKVIKGWEGLKFKYLKELVPLKEDIKNMDDELVEFNEESAQLLMKNSTIFDRWVSDTIEEVSNFNKDS